jgi:hypothetical protein
MIESFAEAQRIAGPSNSILYVELRNDGSTGTGRPEVATWKAILVIRSSGVSAFASLLEPKLEKLEKFSCGTFVSISSTVSTGDTVKEPGATIAVSGRSLRISE